MNARIQNLMPRLRRDEHGLTTVEYVIVLCLIAGLAVGTWQKFGANILGYLTKADSDITSAMSAH